MAEREKALEVVCYKWGAKYPAEDVNVLRAMVERHLNIPHRFHCITDDSSGLDAEIVAHDLPDLGFEGIWRKLWTFSPDFLGLKDSLVVSLDLDVVIVDSLDFVTENPELDFVIARNWARNLEKKGGARGSGTLYRLRVGSMAKIWEEFAQDPAVAIERYHGKTKEIGEQNWLENHVEEGDWNFFPEGKVISFKRHCRAKGRRLLGVDTAQFGSATIPAGAAVISFHGDPLPRDLIAGKPIGRWKKAPFVRQHWRK